MMSAIPFEISKENQEKQILRTGMIAELDATSLYEQMADRSKNPDVQKILLDIAKEEKTHMGEFLALLLNKDNEQRNEIARGQAEVMEKLGKVM